MAYRVLSSMTSRRENGTITKLGRSAALSVIVAPLTSNVLRSQVTPDASLGDLETRGCYDWVTSRLKKKKLRKAIKEEKKVAHSILEAHPEFLYGLRKLLRDPRYNVNPADAKSLEDLCCDGTPVEVLDGLLKARVWIEALPDTAEKLRAMEVETAPSEDPANATGKEKADLSEIVKKVKEDVGMYIKELQDYLAEKVITDKDLERFRRVFVKALRRAAKNVDASTSPAEIKLLCSSTTAAENMLSALKTSSALEGLLRRPYADPSLIQAKSYYLFALEKVVSAQHRAAAKQAAERLVDV